MSGFIAMQRDALDHHLLQDGDRFRAWFWIVANACWKPAKARIKGRTVELERGELSFSVRFLADNWGWSKSRVDRFLSDLRAEGMIETRSKSGTSAGHKAGQGQSIITVCNYSKYQDSETVVRDKREAKSGTSAGQARDKEEEGNKVIRKNTPPTPQGGRKGKTRLSLDWRLPLVSDLPPQARGCAEQWTRASYDTHGEAFKNYWTSEGKMKADWRLTWANRIVDIHDKVLRAQKFGNDPKPSGFSAPGKRDPMTPQAWLSECRRQLEAAEKFKGTYEIEKAREAVAAAERKLNSGRSGEGQSIGSLVKLVASNA